MPLLILADEQENMINKYLNRGVMYILDDNGVKGVCIVTKESDEIIEIKNIAVDPKYQKRGYGRSLINFLIIKYKNNFDILQVGTGNVPSTITFYKKCGFSHSHIIKNFFIENYDHPIYENGIQLIDMVYLQINLKT